MLLFNAVKYLIPMGKKITREKLRNEAEYEGSLSPWYGHKLLFTTGKYVIPVEKSAFPRVKPYSR